ncbi:MAG: phosphoribosylaminoimidazolesuccinocarboxamide synthase [Caldisericia bacterium]|jgi:phosphoribosylaminoimidazole-succinocarboxamide synthase|nr:phosphoribosylaminoimidazolesuccinocarboxamide synthase [Caldisericia bacterium]
MESKPLLSTDMPLLKLFRRGKVRDIFDLGEHLLMVSTDRLSAFDVVFEEGIPHKGIVLNQLASFWFEETKHIISNHFVTTDVCAFYPELSQYQSMLEGRSMIVRKAKPMDFEFIVRGYMMGSAFEQYSRDGSIAGKEYPKGLIQGSKFQTPIFTPSTKSHRGHDVNISLHELQDSIGEEKAKYIEEKSIELFAFASSKALQKGILIADTKFEFGFIDDEMILIDELFTPDSSRFILKKDYEVGYVDRSMDKQFVRNFLIQTGWNKEPPPPALPPDIIQKTSERYLDAYQSLTGKALIL